MIVASQIVDPPPAAPGADADEGAWLALGSALVMCVGAVLTFGRVQLALTVEGRDPRQHVSAVDARGAAGCDDGQPGRRGGRARAGRRPRAAQARGRPRGRGAREPAGAAAARREADAAARPAAPEPEPTEP